MKRLLVRLSLISVVVAVGVFAIVLAQREQAQDGGEPAAPPALPPQVPLTTPVLAESPQASPAEEQAIASLIPVPQAWEEGATGGSFVLPAPTDTIVRGNNGHVEANDDTDSAAGEVAPVRPAPTHLAQAGAPSSRARNPFAPRSAAEEASEFRAPALANTAPAASEASPSASDATYPTAGPTLASPAPAAAMPAPSESSGDEYAPPKFDTPAAGVRVAEASEESPAKFPTDNDASPAAPTLDAPRELPEYAAPNMDAGRDSFAPPRPLAASTSAPQESENGYTISEPASPAPYSAQDELRYGGNGATAPKQPSVSYGDSRSVGSGAEGTGTPGPQELEGPQTPSLMVKKSAPPEIQVGKAAAFEIHVQNVGRVAAHQVIVKEEIPRGVRLIDAVPPAAPQSGSLIWELGTLQPGESRQLKIQYLPYAEGDIGSVAVAAFQTQASVRTVCTRPQLTIEQAAPEKVLLGQAFRVRIRLSNPGTGIAQKVVLEEDVPDGFQHPSGRALEYEVGELRPGETRDLDLTLQAAKPGMWENLLVVRGEGNLVAESTAKVEVVAPQLELAMTGPTRRYLERQATYTVAIANPGTATANDVRVVGRLPKGMKFVAANNEGQYDPKTHAVVWSLAELPPGQVGQVQLTTLPVETGEQKIVVEGQGSLETSAVAEHAVSVEALAELSFEIADKSDPIEVGKEALYEVKVVNKGSKTATNIQIVTIFPPDMKPVAGDGPSRAEVAGARIIFEPLARLNPREEAIFRIQAEGLRPGDQRIQVQLTSDDSPTPVTKEESTRVYSDR